MKEEDRIRCLDTLYTAMASLRSREEIKKFLKDLLTESEKIMIGRRILIAQKLLQDKSYDEIIKEMGVGVDTIIRVHRWLGDGSDGYEKAIKGLEKVFQQRQDRVRQEPALRGSFTWLRRRYPLHFLLFNLFAELKNKK